MTSVRRAALVPVVLAALLPAAACGSDAPGEDDSGPDMSGTLTVLAAASLDEARHAIASDGHAPGAIVADYHLDDGIGIDAIVALREAFGAEIPAMLVTADRSDDVLTRATAADILVLHKPLRPAALRAALSRRRIRRDAAE